MVDDVAVHELTRPTSFRRDTVGFIFQLHYLLPALTAQQNVELPLVAAGMRKPERAERSLALLDEVGLRDRHADLPQSLSGGERQRVAVARALAGRPNLILADEPTGSLDSIASRRIWELLSDVRDRHGTTIIAASHDPMLLEYADRAINLMDGRITGDEELRRETAA